MKSVGRPKKADAPLQLRQQIIDATVRVLSTEGAAALTVRRVCREADVSNGTFYHYFQNKDDLLMYFVKDTLFGEFEVKTPPDEITGRILELYLHLIRKYQSLGKNFMRSFYNTSNTALSAYMGETAGEFAPGTIMARSEIELLEAQRRGVIRADCEVHQVCADICTIVKGCVFEWCLGDGRMDMEAALHRILGHYMRPYIAKPFSAGKYLPEDGNCGDRNDGNRNGGEKNAEGRNFGKGADSVLT